MRFWRDTMILTPEGPVAIEFLKPGGKVMKLGRTQWIEGEIASIKWATARRTKTIVTVGKPLQMLTVADDGSFPLICGDVANCSEGAHCYGRAIDIVEEKTYLEPQPMIEIGLTTQGHIVANGFVVHICA